MEVTEFRVSTHLDSDNDQIKTESLAMTCDTEAQSKAASTSSSQVGFASDVFLFLGS
jgi:hypothetical protein